MTKPDTRQMKSAARLYAVQALFQMEAAEHSGENVIREFEDFRFGLPQHEGGEELAEGNVDLVERRGLTNTPVALNEAHQGHTVLIPTRSHSASVGMWRGGDMIETNGHSISE
mgnify:CR=1 FL=1